MFRKVILCLIWLGFTAYTIWLAPLDQVDTWYFLKNLLTFQLDKVNPIITSIFWLMGVWPMIYACLMFVDGTMQKIPAWPSFIFSNFSGVICLLPYLIFRQSNSQFNKQKDNLLEILDRRSTGIGLLISAIGLLAYAGICGNWSTYFQEFQSISFVHLISIDFCLMCLIFPISSLFDDDMVRRKIKDSRIFWLVALVPLLGPLVYLCLRPSLNIQSPFISLGEIANAKQ